MASLPNVPTVTRVHGSMSHRTLLAHSTNKERQDDLYAFQARLFGQEPATPVVCQNPEDQDDGLGYYPDGVKRTLTDEQISMFRHSEIYSLLRQRQLKRERDETEADQISENSADKGVTANAQRLLEEDMDTDSDDDEEYAQFLEAEQRQLRAQALKKKKKKKRKLDTPEVLGERVNPFTARRIAREMDETIADNTTLEYGEEERSNCGQVRGQRNLDQFNDRDRVVYEDTVKPIEVERAHEQQGSVLEARKIWWPVIGRS